MERATREVCIWQDQHGDQRWAEEWIAERLCYSAHHTFCLIRDQRIEVPLIAFHRILPKETSSDDTNNATQSSSEVKQTREHREVDNEAEKFPR